MLGASSSGRGGGIQQSARSRSTNGKSSTSKMEKTANEINLVPPSTQPSFDMLVLGCGGGPAENDLSAYWVKPAGQAWRDGFISVDGGGRGSDVHVNSRMLLTRLIILKDPALVLSSVSSNLTHSPFATLSIMASLSLPQAANNNNTTSSSIDLHNLTQALPPRAQLSYKLERYMTCFKLS